MSKKRMQCFILVLVFCMILMICYFMKLQQKDLIEYLSFVDNTHQLPIAPYYDEVEDKYYLFLPSYASPEDIIPRCPSNVNIRFGGGDEFSKLPLSEDVPMILSTPSRTEEYTLQIWPCANLTTIYLETQSGSMDYVHEDKNNKEDVSVSIINSDGTIELSGMAELNGRGNTTWEAEKKPYNLTFSHGISFGAFEDISKFCLFADYYDESKMRNATVYYAAQELDFSYSSPYVFTDLFINGEYHGLYSIATKQEYIKHIEEDQLEAVFEVSNIPGEHGFYTSLGVSISTMHGNSKSLNNILNTFEEALINQDWKLCEQIIDIESFAKKYVLEEFFGNWDLPRPSKYYYIGNDQKIYCMMPWDYDGSFGALDYLSKICENEIYAYACNPIGCWFTHLLNNDDFIREVIKCLNIQYSNTFLEKLLVHIKDTSQHIESSYLANALRWNNPKISNQVISDFEGLHLYNFYGESQNYFPNRRDFLLDYFSSPEKYFRIDVKGWYLPSSDDVYYLPAGIDLGTYLNDSNFFVAFNTVPNFLYWDTDNGTDPYTVGTLESDITFYAVFDFEELSSP